MDFDRAPTDLDDILDTLDAPPPPRRRRSMTEFCEALDRGDAAGFFLDDFEEHERGRIAQRFGLTFLDGSPWSPPEAPPGAAPEQDGASPPAAAADTPARTGPGPCDAPAPTAEPAKPAASLSGPLGGFVPPPVDRLPPYQNTNALFLDPRIAPASPAAEALVADLVGRLLDLEQRRGTRKKKRSEAVQRQFRDAVGAITGNLLRAWAEEPPVAVYRSCNVNAFAAEGVPWRTFLGTLKAMVRLRLVLHRPGGKAKDKPDGWAARYWPDLDLLRAAAAHGIDPAGVRDAFRRRPSSTAAKAPKVKEPLRLKAFKRHPNGRAPRLPIDFADPVAAALRAEVEAMNAFAASAAVEGCVPPRWFRQFIGDFRLFGRFSALGTGNYQSMPAADRLGSIRIAGEAVVEIDIRSSLLAILHGVLGLPLPEGDLYDLPGIPREVAKLCVNATLGRGTPVDKWSKDSRRRLPELDRCSASAVMAAAVARYPFMAEPWRAAEGFRHLADPKRVLIHMLMGVESDIILDTLQALRAEGVLGLPTHDGLVVPASAEARACELLLAAGERVAGVELRLKVDRPTSAGP